jgi:UDP-3-O-[3-hydroxymyristoyl] glucosamine N-acyltransferase
MLAACAEISGSVKIGKNCWIGPNSTIKDQVFIGDNVFLGIGSIISENIRDKDKKCSLSNLSFRDCVKITNFLKSKK